MHKTKNKGTWLENLNPEELAPRLEMQILVDPMAALGFQNASNEINCKAGSNCCADGGKCSVKAN